MDGHEKGDVDKIYTPENIKAMRSAGLRPLTYRLRTELGVEAWHWNPKGTWSDPTHKQGYWTSDDHSAAPILTCYGYRLPRRGNTIDQANNDSYSRLDDGDTSTFWKSNPYLDRHFTGEENDKHPQWVVIDLEKQKKVDTIRILWGTPYATRYRVEYWEGPDAIYINENAPGQWKAFPQGSIQEGRGGDVTLRLSPSPFKVRFVRVIMTESARPIIQGSKDIRDRLGYAIRELYLGVSDNKGRFTDVLRHGRTNTTQNVMYASSTDPWHRANDIDTHIEQPGFDRVIKSGLTNGLNMLMPVALLYDTPENMRAEIRFLRSRHCPVSQIEMGEEPDGQYITPEDYGAFYVRWADMIHAIDPSLVLGGPCFQTTVTDVAAWPDKPGNRSWMNRFLKYLKERKHEKDYAFFSFEWYPFDDVCAPTAPQLARAPELLAGVLKRLQASGLSPKIPWMITEYGYSAFAGEAEVDVAGGLLNADIVGQFLTLGGDVAYFYGYEPNSLIKELPKCDTWGNLALFLSDDERKIKAPLATYHAAKLYAQEWAQPGNGKHEVYEAASDITNPRGQALVTSYALRRPDGRWAVMLINKDPKKTYTIHIRFADSSSKPSSFKGPVDLYQFSGKQYQWKANKDKGYPTRSLPPAHTVVPEGENATYQLPPYSLSVVRGRGPDN